jgi:hypothetical protein
MAKYKSIFFQLFFLISFLLCVLHSEFANAQRFAGSVIAGLSATQVAGDQLSGFNKSGFIAGGSVSNKLSEKFSLEMEIKFAQKGSKSVRDTLTYKYYRMSLNYVEVPLLLQYNYSKKFQFNVGISIGSLVSHKEEDQYGIIPDANSLPFEKVEYAVCGGMYYGITENFFLNLRMSNSILPIRKLGDNSLHLSYLQSGQYNTVLEFTLKYRFGRGM